MTLSAGTRLGPYEILSPLGAGGMGEVYRARDSKLKRDVAVKVLPRSLAADADALARFEREALAVAALSHPNILAIHDFGTHEGMAYAVTELLEGETLRGKIDAGPIAQKQAVDYALQVAKGLSAAHEKGIVHRDLKPENLFVARDGHLKILDFGLAKKVETVAPGKETEAPTGSGHTEPGTVMGTMGYMSPEQVRGLPVDHRSDLFSFGAILYELLSGKRAFKRDTASDTIAAILKEEPPELTQSVRMGPGLCYTLCSQPPSQPVREAEVREKNGVNRVLRVSRWLAVRFRSVNARLVFLPGRSGLGSYSSVLGLESLPCSQEP
jgi:serine/threonine protein kinase